MKIPTLLMLALCASAPMFAQSAGTFQVTRDASVTVYGLLDVGLGVVNHSLNFDPLFPTAVSPVANKTATTSATGMFNGGLSQSRFGIKGDYDLGKAWKAVVTLEGTINVPSGNVANAALGLAQQKPGSATGNTSADSAASGQLFARQSNFGVSSDTYGTLTAGRHSSFMLDTIPAYDALQGSQMFTPTGYSGSYGGGGATDDSRLDNSFKYRIKVGDFNFGAMHKFGGVSGAYSAQSANQIIAGYEKGGFGFQAVYQANTDAFSVANSATAGTVALTAENTKSYLLAAKYQFGKLHIKAGYEKIEYTNPSNPGADQLTSIYGQVVTGAVTTNTYASGEKVLNVAWLGLVYDLTPKLNIAIEHFNIGQNDYSGAPVPAVLGTKNEGNSKYDSLLLDYRVSKAFDIYAGRMNTKLSNGMAVGYTNPANAITGLGARLSF